MKISLNISSKALKILLLMPMPMKMNLKLSQPHPPDASISNSKAEITLQPNCSDLHDTELIWDAGWWYLCPIFDLVLFNIFLILIDG